MAAFSRTPPIITVSVPPPADMAHCAPAQTQVGACPPRAIYEDSIWVPNAGLDLRRAALAVERIEASNPVEMRLLGARVVVFPARVKSQTAKWERTMTSITGIARNFFEACETGKGWEGCKAYCKTDATFSAQAEPLAGVKTLQEYTDWMKGLLTFVPDGRYELKCFGTDDERKSVCAYGVFFGTHTGQGGPCPPTGKSVKSDYVYVMDFDGEKIRHMTKIWHAGLAMKELGWI